MVYCPFVFNWICFHHLVISTTIFDMLFGCLVLRQHVDIVTLFSSHLSINAGDIWAASRRNHVCGTCRKLWGKVLLHSGFNGGCKQFVHRKCYVVTVMVEWMFQDCFRWLAQHRNLFVGLLVSLGKQQIQPHEKLYQNAQQVRAQARST